MGEIGELMALATELANEDVKLFYEFEALRSSGRDRRFFVRAFFATVEALLWTFKQIALARAGAVSGPFTPTQINELREWKEVPAGEGVTLKSVRLSFEENAKLAFRALSTAYEVPLEIEIGGREWKTFLEAAAVRNRLMHPKRKAHFEVTDDEVSCIAGTYHWFWKEAIGLMNTIAARPGHSWPTDAPFRVR